MTESFGQLLDFVVIGAMKSGTTSIDRNLKHCKDVRLLPTKYGTRTILFGNGKSRKHTEFARRYAEEFRRTTPEGTLVGHIKGDYHSDLSAMDELIEAPDLKLVLSYRDPVARLYSHYTYCLMQGYTHLAFEEWTQTEEGISGVRHSSFGQCLSCFAGRLTPERFAVIAMEETSTPEGIEALARFLGVTLIAQKTGTHNVSLAPRDKRLNYIARQVIDATFPRETAVNEKVNKLRRKILLGQRKPERISPETQNLWRERFAEDFQDFLRLAAPFRLLPSDHEPA